MKQKEGYDELLYALMKAFERASEGKGAERHGMGLPFNEQPIMQIQRMLGGIEFPLGQIMKKAPELNHFQPDEAQKELLDIIVYAAASYSYLDEQPTLSQAVDGLLGDMKESQHMGDSLEEGDVTEEYTTLNKLRYGMI